MNEQHQPNTDLDDADASPERTSNVEQNENGLPITRRRLLQGAGAVGAISMLSGVGQAQEDPEVPERPKSGRHIVGTMSAQVAANAVRAEADSVHRVLDFGSIGKAVAGRFSDQALNALTTRNNVRYVEADGTMHATAQTLPWGVDRVDAELVYAQGKTGEGADITIIDTGIDEDHLDLAANLGAGESFVDYTNSWDDDEGHGTHCAGIAGAIDNTQGVVGVAPGATLHAAKVLDSDGFGSFSDIAASIEWTADQGYDIGNMSLGGPSSQTVEDACLYAHNRAVLLVAAAGNDYGRPVDYPAAYSTVIAVSSIDSDDSLSNFSNVGPEIELAAPGGNIYSTIPGSYGTKSGTSMACPHVSGAGGQLMALGFSSGDTRQRLRARAEDIGLTENEQGYGLLDVEAAVADPIGETGTVTTNQSNFAEWHTVTLTRTYADPTVIMTPPSYDGIQPCHVRLRNVNETGFEFKLEEWLYQDGGHRPETLHYVVMERGLYTLPDGTKIKAGSLSGIDNGFSTASYGFAFENVPVSITQPQTHNGRQPIVSRQRNIGTESHEVRVQEEETGGFHKDERVGMIIVEPGTGSFAGSVPFEVDRTSDAVTHKWYRINFEQTYENPVFVAGMQTFDGFQSAGLRYRNLTGSSVEMKIEEEQSKDNETGHVTEVVGYLVVEDSTGAFGAVLG